MIIERSYNALFETVRKAIASGYACRFTIRYLEGATEYGPTPVAKRLPVMDVSAPAAASMIWAETVLEPEVNTYSKRPQSMTTVVTLAFVTAALPVPFATVCGNLIGTRPECVTQGLDVAAKGNYREPQEQ